MRGRAIGLISSAYFAAPIPGVPLAAQIADRFGWRRAFLFFAVLALGLACGSLTLPNERVSPPPSAGKLGTVAPAFCSFLVRCDLAAARGISFLVSSGPVAFMTYIGQWLNNHFGIPMRTLGWVFALGGLVAVVGARLGGILSDRWARRAVSIASNMLRALSILLIPFTPWGIWPLVLIAGASFGTAFRQGRLTALMTEMVRAAQGGWFIAL